MKSEKELKDKFVKMFKFVILSGNGFICLFDDIEYGEKNIEIRNDPDYPFLKKKMSKVLKLINY